MKKAILALVALAAASPASAHMVWIERPSADVARAYFGEPDDREKTGGMLDKLVPAIFTKPAKPLPFTRGADFIEVKAKGDVRLADERYPPFTEGEMGAIRPMMYARHGRTETVAKTAFEFVPAAPGANSFTLLADKAAVADAKVTVTGPGGAETSYQTDAKGGVTIAAAAPGQYILHASRIERTPGKLGDAPYDVVARVTTLTFNRD